MNDKKIGPTMVLKRFFGYRPDQELTGFSAEINALSADERITLAKDAARALNLTADEVSFEL